MRWVVGIVVALIMCSGGLYASDIMAGDSAKYPFAATIDIRHDGYNRKIAVSGFDLRLMNFGFGVHFGEGESSFASEENISTKPDPDHYVHDHLKGVYGDIHYYYDIKPLFTSIIPRLGFGSTSGKQLVHVGYIGSYPDKPEYDLGFVYGLGFQTYPYANLVVGFKWDSMNRFSFQIGYGGCGISGGYPITNYFKSR